MKKLNKFIIVLGLMAVPFAACSADAASGLFEVQMKLALKGKPQDQYFLGVMYEEGLGAEVDIKSARMWYQKSAQQNYALAITKLKDLDNPKPVVVGIPPLSRSGNKPVKKKVVRESAKVNTGISEQKLAAKRELEKKRKAWLKAMRNQSKYAEDAFE